MCQIWFKLKNILEKSCHFGQNLTQNLADWYVEWVTFSWKIGSVHGSTSRISSRMSLILSKPNLSTPRACCFAALMIFTWVCPHPHNINSDLWEAHNRLHHDFFPKQQIARSWLQVKLGTVSLLVISSRLISSATSHTGVFDQIRISRKTALKKSQEKGVLCGEQKYISPTKCIPECRMHSIICVLTLI